MSSVGHVDDGRVAPSSDVTHSWYSCTGCMRCTTFCEHGIDVAQALYDARDAALKAKPDDLARARQQQARRSRVAAKRAKRLFAHRVNQSAQGRSTLFAGCTALSNRGDDAKAAGRIMQTLNREAPALEFEACCGFPLLEAGDRAGFEENMRTLVNRLGASKEVVFLDPGCLHGLHMYLDQVPSKVGFRALHISEFLAQHQNQLRAAQSKKFANLRYHDACHLGRGLNVYDQPRDVLRALTGEELHEFSARRRGAECSGAGGRFPETHPADALKIANELQASHQRQGGGTLVTCCPGALTHLKRAGNPGDKITSFVEIVDHALHGERAHEF